ncbi:MAG TPA: hypothetical protein VLP43_04105, partial [Solirubrobacteraceae bacterium]|nr:hypothetical protein [Solirubrobacteraceae bacterium]
EKRRADPDTQKVDLVYSKLSKFDKSANQTCLVHMAAPKNLPGRTSRPCMLASGHPSEAMRRG